jgi:hypothetical protein
VSAARAGTANDRIKVQIAVPVSILMAILLNSNFPEGIERE